MRKITPADLMPLAQYEGEREAHLERALEARRLRRVELAEGLALVFESLAAWRFQLQELMRAEKLEQPSELGERLEAFEAVLPDAGELCATLFVESSGGEVRGPWLERLAAARAGEGEGIALHVDDRDPVPGRLEEVGPGEPLRAVHAVRFALPEAVRERLRSGAGARVVLALHDERFVAELDEPVRAALVGDLEQTG